MGLDVGGYHDRPDWPKMGPSLLIATCLILAIRTAKWKPNIDPSLAHQDMNEEIQFAANMAYRVFAVLISKYEVIFPQKKQPWYQANEDDVRK